MMIGIGTPSNQRSAPLAIVASVAVVVRNAVSGFTFPKRRLVPGAATPIKDFKADDL